MKKINFVLFITLLTVIWHKQGSAQLLDTNWVRHYGETTSFNDKINIAALNDEKYLVQHGNDYYIISKDGDSLNAGTFDASHNVKSVWSKDSLIFMGSVVSNEPVISRLDTAINILWSTPLFTSGFAEGVYAMLADSQHVYVSGSHQSNKPFTAKLDFSGNIIWTKEHPQSTFANLTSLIKLKDGNYLASGHLDDYPLAVKFNSLGDTIWTYYEPIFISFYRSAAAEKGNNEIILAMRDHIIVLDAAGNRVDSIHHEVKEYFHILALDDTLYFFGEYVDTTVSPQKRHAYVEAKNHDLDSLNAFTWESDLAVSGRFNSAVFSGNNSFITAGHFRDSAGLTANTWNTLCARFNYAPEPPSNHTATISQTAPVAVYPNPVQDILFIEADDIEAVKATDILGRTTKFEINDNRLNVSTLIPGVYILTIKTSEKTYQARVVKQ